jgi:hypothetical protein
MSQKLTFKKHDRIIYADPGYWNNVNKTRTPCTFIELRGKKSALIELYGKKKTVRLDSLSDKNDLEKKAWDFPKNKN